MSCYGCAKLFCHSWICCCQLAHSKMQAILTSPYWYSCIRSIVHTQPVAQLPIRIIIAYVRLYALRKKPAILTSIEITGMCPVCVCNICWSPLLHFVKLKNRSIYLYLQNVHYVVARMYGLWHWHLCYIKHTTILTSGTPHWLSGTS